MKKLAFIFMIAVLFNACKKEKPISFQSKGILLGGDMAMCPMCGGMKVKILTNDPNPNPPGFYRTNTNLDSLGFTAPDGYPVNVLLNWKRGSATYAGGFIIITKIKLDN